MRRLRLECRTPPSASLSGHVALRRLARWGSNWGSTLLGTSSARTWRGADFPRPPAEGLGFEPRETRKPQRFSRPPHSTALPPLRGNKHRVWARARHGLPPIQAPAATP